MHHENSRASPVLLTVAVLAGVPPVVGVKLAYCVASTAGTYPRFLLRVRLQVDWRNRSEKLPESIAFKGTMLPTAMFYVDEYAAWHWLQLPCRH